MPYFQTIDQGHVTLRKPGDVNPTASGPRCVATPGGELVCSYMVQSKLAINDFVPTLSRSADNGKTWREQGPVWPGLIGKWSFFVNISRDASGRLFLFGSRCKIETQGESFWSDATQGIKTNEMIWASSEDGGRTWSEPRVIGNLMACSAEAPGPLAVCSEKGAGRGAWVGPYSPYNTFDPNLKVDRAQVVALLSTDRGATWSRGAMLRFDDATTGGAEAWCIELSDGTLLATTWNVDHAPAGADGHKRELPNKWAVSSDGGATWSPTRSTGTLGHTTALTALPPQAGRRPGALFVNVRRKPASDVGVWLAVVRPSGDDFGIEHNERVWSPGQGATKTGGIANADNWSDFTFGEPSATILPDGDVLIFLWYIDKQDSGVRWLRLRPATPFQAI